jgi:SAM-dependent methyltransferase
LAEYQTYWNNRYRGTCGAGGGTYGREAEWTRHELYKVVSDTKAETVTDVGCGECDLWSGKLPVPEESYFGIDISPLAIESAKSKFTKGTFVVGDITKLIDEQVSIEGWNDLLICTDLMFHLNPIDARKLAVWMYQSARKAIAIKTIFDCGDSPEDLHWDHRDMFAPPKDWKIMIMQKHPHNHLARFVVAVRNGQR